MNLRKGVGGGGKDWIHRNMVIFSMERREREERNGERERKEGKEGEKKEGREEKREGEREWRNLE